MAHTFSNILIHALFSTKHRRPYLDDELTQELFPSVAPPGDEFFCPCIPTAFAVGHRMAPLRG